MNYSDNLSLAIRSLFRLNQFKSNKLFPSLVLQTEEELYQERWNKLTKEEKIFIKRNQEKLLADKQFENQIVEKQIFKEVGKEMKALN